MESTEKKEIDGLEFTVDRDKAGSWGALKMLRRARDLQDDGVGQLDALLELVGYVTDVDVEAIVAHCGGDSAQVKDVAILTGKIISECFPKN